MQSPLPFPEGQGEEGNPPQHIGQVFTPPAVASLAMDMLDESPGQCLRVLDAGAGGGALVDALVSSQVSTSAARLDLSLIERDGLLAEHLRDAVPELERQGQGTAKIDDRDFLTIPADDLGQFDIILMNPPYARLHRSMRETQLVRDLGIRTPNLYAAFLWRAIDLLAPDGQIVAILPRSFCSGGQFQWLRNHMFASCSLRKVHLFHSRDQVFRQDRVLQETVVIQLVKAARPSSIQLSWSTGADNAPITRTLVTETRIVKQDDRGFFILIPADEADARLAPRPDAAPLLRPFTVSTGQIVDFRYGGQIHPGPGARRVPLIGSNFVGSGNRRRGLESQRHLEVHGRARQFIMPVGNYIVINRISPKESVPRIRPRWLSAAELSGFDGVAFENHVNFVHHDGGPLDEKGGRRVLGLLRSDDVQRQLMERTGSTQVNLSDLRALMISDEQEEDT